jgi:hypothetical protein
VGCHASKNSLSPFFLLQDSVLLAKTRFQERSRPMRLREPCRILGQLISCSQQSRNIPARRRGAATLRIKRVRKDA